ncbi:hypothetical protein AB0F81_00355 [Actinoplanes sp. NPDC024001]|uniref:HAAS signaling domain-containing protein n=1 Tax=Actinoplanes sp. NPDC024001 TaxID=3154598 RepID=UPI0033EF3202
MIKSNDSLVSEYLARVSRATAGLPPERQDELLRDLREHIDSGRADLLDETEAQVREILDRLGDPEIIARAAAEEAGAATPPPLSPLRYPTQPSPRRRLWPIAVAVVAILGVLVFCTGSMFLVRADDGSDPLPVASVPGRALIRPPVGWPPAGGPARCRGPHRSPPAGRRSPGRPR